MNKEQWKEREENFPTPEGYKAILLPEDEKEKTERKKIRENMKLDAEKAIAANNKKSAAARKRHYVKMLIVRAKTNKAFRDMAKRGVKNV